MPELALCGGKTMRENWKAIAVVAGIILVGMALFFLLFEYVPDQARWKPTRAAQRNPFLGAEILLEKHGFNVETNRDPTFPDERPAEKTLLILVEPQMAAEDLRSHMLNWSQNGGNILIVDSLNTNNQVSEDIIVSITEESSLGSQLGYSLKSRTPSEGHQYGEMKHENQVHPFKNADSTLFVLPEHMQPDSAYSLDSAIQVQDAYAMLGFQVGEGYIHVINHWEWLTNERLLEAEHGAIFKNMVTPDGTYQTIIFYEPKPFHEVDGYLLLNRAGPFLIALLLLTTMLLWHLMPRFGPILPDPPPQRRELLEHIEASGQFLWRHDHDNNLLKGVRKATWNRVLKSRPAWAQIPKAECFNLLGELIGVHGYEVRSAMEERQTHNMNTLNRWVAILEKIRRQL